MSYASWPDVAALNKARKLGAGENPTEGDVQFYCENSAAEINAILLNKGYGLPIPAEATEALALLRKINAEGGLVQMEKASPTRDGKQLTSAEASYAASLKDLREATEVLGIPKETGRSRPRGPGVTTAPPSNDPCQTRPYFSRQMMFAPSKV